MLSVVEVKGGSPVIEILPPVSVSDPLCCHPPMHLSLPLCSPDCTFQEVQRQQMRADAAESELQASKRLQSQLVEARREVAEEAGGLREREREREKERAKERHSRR